MELGRFGDGKRRLEMEVVDWVDGRGKEEKGVGGGKRVFVGGRKGG